MTFPRRRLKGFLAICLLGSLGASLSACGLGGRKNGDDASQKQIERLSLRVDQLEQRLNDPSLRPGPAPDGTGTAPAGPVQSLTFRMGSGDGRLRIYWEDGTTSDLPCSKEPPDSWACG